MTKIYILKCLLSFVSFCVAVWICVLIFHLQQSAERRLIKTNTLENTQAVFQIRAGQNNTENHDHIQNHIQNLNRQSLRRSLIIFGHDRSGTTFISSMFAKDPQMFMVYEPLWITQHWKNNHFDCINCELKVVSSIVSCNFSQFSASRKFLSYVTYQWTEAMPINIFKTRKFCNVVENAHSKVDCPDLSKNPRFVDYVCEKKFNHSVVKVSPVRLPQEKLSSLIPQVLLENPDIDVRILHLVRDPRGNINSRINIKWVEDYPNPSLGKTAREICDTILANLEHADKSLKKFNLSQRYKLVLYKQIADDPLGIARDIYKFAGIEMPLETERWIIESTKPSEDQLKKALKNPYSPVRNATGNADKWRKDEFFERNRVIEKECKVLMNFLGLKKVPEPEKNSKD